MMVPEMEKPRVTEIKVRMDCNGCVHKIKKALNGIKGIYDIYIDFPQQKLTIIGWADPATIVKAIKKTRKSAVICSHTEQSDQTAQQPDDGPPEDGAPPPESDGPQTEPPQTEAAVPPEVPLQSENSPLQEAFGDAQPPQPKEPEEVHVINHHPPDYGHRYVYDHYHQQPPKPKEPEEVHVVNHHPPNSGHRYAYGHYHQQEGQHSTSPRFRADPPQPMYTQSYNTYKPPPYVTEYVHPHAPPSYSPYSRPDHYRQVYYNGTSSNNNGNDNSNGNRNVTSMSRGDPPQPVNVTHNYNVYKSSPYVSEYANPDMPPSYSSYNRPGNYSQVYYNGNSSKGNNNNDNDNDTSRFTEGPPRPMYGTHNYNTYKPSPYVTEYAYPYSQPSYSPYSRPDHYNQVYYNGSSSNDNDNGNRNITSMFSEENPNSCTIV